MLRLAELCTSSTIQQLLDSISDASQRNHNKKTLLFSALKEMECYVVHARTINPQVWRTYSAILDDLVVSWITAQNHRSRRKEESDRLYRNRTVDHQGELSDAQAEKKALEQLFPSYEDEFSADNAVADDGADRMDVVHVDEQPDDSSVIDFDLTDADQQLISSSHVNLLTSWTRSMITSKKTADKSTHDPFEGKFRLILDSIPFINYL